MEIQSISTGSRSPSLSGNRFAKKRTVFAGSVAISKCRQLRRRGNPIDGAIYGVSDCLKLHVLYNL